MIIIITYEALKKYIYIFIIHYPRMKKLKNLKKFDQEIISLKVKTFERLFNLNTNTIFYILLI